MKNARAIVKKLLIRGKKESEVKGKDEDMELNGNKEEDLDELAFNSFGTLWELSFSLKD
jgi:hypothetical protein